MLHQKLFIYYGMVIDYVSLNTTPPLLNMQQGDAPLIITMPHNGFYVPPEFYTQSGDPLGVPASWFDPQDPEHRHNACDWGVQQLSDYLKERFAGRGVIFLEATHSRLLVDLNRNDKHFITTAAADIDTIIPGNNNLTAFDIRNRKAQYYTPWFNALAHGIDHITQKYERVRILDLHSYTPMYKGKPRKVDIGTINLVNTSYASDVETFLDAGSRRSSYVFESNSPYDLAASKELGDKVVIEDLVREFSLMNYVGIEIKNGFLQNPEHFNNMAGVMGDLVEYILSRPPEMLPRYAVD